MGFISQITNSMISLKMSKDKKTVRLNTSVAFRVVSLIYVNEKKASCDHRLHSTIKKCLKSVRRSLEQINRHDKSTSYERTPSSNVKGSSTSAN